MSVSLHRPVQYEPVEVAPETYLLRTAFATDEAAMTMYQSSMVIRGAEPVLVDTGPAAAADLWMHAAFGLVDPEDVSWIFVSHNDSDHSGNVLASLAACPNATLLTTSPAVLRLTSSFDLPYRRMAWLRAGETFGAGDRTIEIIDPVVYDSPVTQGLLDRSTGVMWAVDAFAAPVPTVGPPAFARDLPRDEWESSLSALGIAGNPWLEGVRPEWFASRVRSMTDLEPTVVASAHGPTLDGELIGRAAELYAALPGSTPPRGAGQDALHELLRAHHA
jgi:hypothetical protein